MELLNWIDAHGQTAFVVGVFLMIAGGSLLTFLANVIARICRMIRPIPPEAPCKCACHETSCEHCHKEEDTEEEDEEDVAPEDVPI
jgi:hypothetical protein